MPNPPLAGLKILDLSSGPAGGLATMILADYGANVSRLPDPEYDALNDMPSARMWLRGKSTLGAIADEIEHSDVIVISHPNGHQRCDYEHCSAINPAVVYCEISAMGADSPMPMYEGVVAARAGRMNQMESILPGGGPCFAAVQVATHATAMNVVSGVLAALHKRRSSGTGERLSTTLVQGLMPHDVGASLALQLRAQNPRPPQPPRKGPPPVYMPTLNYHPVQCSDGKWLQLGNLLPHLFQSYMRAIGLEDQLEELPDNTEEVRDKILAMMQTRTRDEWMAIFVADGGVAAHPYLSPEEALEDPDMTENGHVVELSGVTQLGPLADLTVTPAKVTESGKSGDGWGAPARVQASDRAAPLKGVTVVELATIIASPLGASFLADMGARVIKVEAIGGDPFRNMGGQGSTRCNLGKESICVDLKSDQGQSIVKELIAKADILIHNYRPGVPERLGIGYEQLSAAYPQLIYVSANGYGPAGPGARRPSTHPIPGAAMGGAGYQAGGTPDELLDIADLREASRRLMSANEVNPDPNTAVVVCASALLGLAAREQTGEGQQIFVDMFGANAYANFDSMVNFDGKPERPGLGENLEGPHPLCRLYRASEGWIFLGIGREAEWRDFCAVTNSGWLEEYDFAGSLTGLTDRLSEHFAARPAKEWEDLFAPTSVACVVADQTTTAGFFFEQCKDDSPWMMPVLNPDLETYYRHRSMVSFENSDLPEGATEGAGGHADALMHELGYDENDVGRCFAEGVLWRPS